MWWLGDQAGKSQPAVRELAEALRGRARVRSHRICERSDSARERDDSVRERRDSTRALDDCVRHLCRSAREHFHPLTERYDRAACAVAPLAS